MARNRTRPSVRQADRLQRWLMSLWRLVGWPLFGATVSTAAVLGYVGFRLYFETQPVRKAPSDLAYLSLQLFVLESGSVPETGAPWQLEVARLLAPATTGVAIAVALAAVFRGEWEELRLRRRKRHVVVCGLGERGARLVGALLEAGYRVVAIERDPTAPAIAEVRRRGALVVVGDARTSQVLCRARVERARYVVALTGTDDVNAELAIRAGELALDRGPALTCLAHVKDPELCALLRSEELAAGHSDYRLDFFNIYEQAARALLRDHPPFRVSEDEPCLLLIGFDRLGQAVVVEAARQWRAHPEARERPLAITVLDPVAAPIGDLLRTRFPQLEHVARLRVMTAEFDPLDCSAVESGPWDAVYVCVDDDSTALEAALQARQCLGSGSVPVVVELTRSAGLSELLERQTVYQGLHAFDLIDRTLRPELLLGGTYEILARAIHQEYVDEQRKQGATAASNPSLVPWEQLPDALKESNRDQAAHIGKKLAAIGCGVAPLADWDADRLVFTDTEIELLAEMEHERWVEQRIRDGWIPGLKNIERKTSPYLVPWGQLSQDVQEWDRRVVRGIPRFLAKAGYQVVRAHAAAP